MEIPYRKSKNLSIYLAGVLLFIAALFLIFMPPTTPHPILGSPVFFGIISGLLLFSSWRLFRTAWQRNKSKSWAMLINEEGLQDFSSRINKGFIHWKEVAGLEIKEVVSSKFIVVYLQDPETYLANQKKGWRKEQLIDRYTHYGSPYCISVAAMHTNTKALFEALEKYRLEYKEKQAN